MYPYNPSDNFDEMDGNAEIVFSDLTSRTQKNDTKHLAATGNWSPDNPYIDALRNTKNKKNRQSLFNSAMAWEESRGNANFENAREDYLLDRQRSLELADREHQEKYDSPVAQAARMRAAGINPDLQQVSGGSSLDPQNEAGSAASQQSAGLETPQPTDALDIVNTVLNGAGTVVSMATGIYGIISGALSLPGQIANVASQTGLNEANARLIDAQIPNISKQGELFDEQILDTRAAASQKKSQLRLGDFNFVRDAIEYVAGQVDDQGNPVAFTTDDVMKFIDDSGYEFSGGMEPRKIIETLQNNAGMRQYLSDRRFKMKQAEALDKANTFETLRSTFEYAARGHNLDAFRNFNRARYLSAYERAKAESATYATDLASADINNASIAADESAAMADGNIGQIRGQFLATQVKKISDNYVKVFDILGDLDRETVAEIEALRKKGNLNFQDIAKIRGLEYVRSVINSVGQDFAGDLGYIYQDAYRTLLSTQVEGKNLMDFDPDLDVDPYYVNFIFSPDRNGETIVREGVSAGVDVLQNWLGGAKDRKHQSKENNKKLATAALGAIVTRGLIVP